MSPGLFRKAMGNREFDEITIENKWARVTIVKQEGIFVMSGDAEGAYANLTDAIEAGLKELAAYEQGRAD